MVVWSGFCSSTTVYANVSQAFNLHFLVCKVPCTQGPQQSIQWVAYAPDTEIYLLF